MGLLKGLWEPLEATRIHFETCCAIHFSIFLSFFFYELSFIYGNIRTAVWETAPQTALRNCSKDIRGRTVIDAVKHVYFFRKFLLVL